MLNMDLQNTSGELHNVTAFEGSTNALLGVPAKDFHLLFVEPGADKWLLDNIYESQFVFDLSIKISIFVGEETQSIVVLALKLS